MSSENITPEMLRQIPALVDIAIRQQQEAAKAQEAQQQAAIQAKMLELDVRKKVAEIHKLEAQAKHVVPHEET